MVELYTMIKFSLLVTPTNFRRRLSIKWIMRCLQDHGCIQVGSAADDVVFEVHPPGTGERLAALAQALTDAVEPRVHLAKMVGRAVHESPD